MVLRMASVNINVKQNNIITNATIEEESILLFLYQQIYLKYIY